MNDVPGDSASQVVKAMEAGEIKEVKADTKESKDERGAKETRRRAIKGRGVLQGCREVTEQGEVVRRAR